MNAFNVSWVWNFSTLRRKITAGQRDYNLRRRHSSLRYRAKMESGHGQHESVLENDDCSKRSAHNVGPRPRT